jgi:hypothetical protein
MPQRIDDLSLSGVGTGGGAEERGATGATLGGAEDRGATSSERGVLLSIGCDIVAEKADKIFMTRAMTNLP